MCVALPKDRVNHGVQGLLKRQMEERWILKHSRYGGFDIKRDRGVHLVFVAEVEVDRSDGHASGSGNVGNRGLLITLLSKEGTRSVQDRVPLGSCLFSYRLRHLCLLMNELHSFYGRKTARSQALTLPEIVQT